MSDSDIVARIKLLIDEKTEGVKKDFADMLGISPSSLNVWLKTGSSPSAEHLVNIKKRLKVNINWLLTGVGPMYMNNSLRRASLTKKEKQVLAAYKNAGKDIKEIVDLALKIRKASRS
ncbi:MAG: helix-turn-helix transcriptional regulator [Nitrospinota bacterium]